MDYIVRDALRGRPGECQNVRTFLCRSLNCLHILGHASAMQQNEIVIAEK